MDVYIKILSDAGVLSDIYAAIDTYDMAKVVGAASNAFEKIKFSRPVVKSKEESATSRILGNRYYRADMYRQALQCYNKALVYAPKHSKDMILAYSNRSAVFFSIRYFTACLHDINTCLSMGCSEDLTNKLKKRGQDALRSNYEFHMPTDSVFANTYLRFKCKRNPDVACASADVTFMGRDGEKRATAGVDIRPGTVVAYERAFATCPSNDQDSKYLSCYYCNRADLCLQPCEGCCRALFCGNECRDLCMKEYHSIECQIVDYLETIYDNQIVDYLVTMYDNQMNVLATRTALKLSLMMPWDKFITASRDIGKSRIRTATVRETFNSDEPLSILSYEPNEQLMEGKMFNGSLYCAFVLKRLQQLGDKCYFPEEPTKRKEAMDAMARVMLYLYVTFSKKIPILSSGYDFSIKSYRSSVQDHVGWFSMCSKLSHSCEPNLLVLGLNDSVALVALRTIRRGEELTISFSGHFYDGTIPNPNRGPLRRATDLFLGTRIMCHCRVCQLNWNRDSAVYVKMTKKQSKLLAKLESRTDMMSQDCFNAMCAALDAFPVNSIQQKWVYDNVRKVLTLPECKHCLNVAYM